MPAIPLVMMGVSAGISAYQAHKQGQAADAQKGLMGSQQGLMGQQSGLANTMSDIAKKQYTLAQPALSKAMNYYSTLATGGRGAVNSMLAPQMAQMTDTYKGAQTGMESKMAPGPGRDRAMADMFRQKAGQISMMPMQARQMGVQGMATMGQDRMNSSMDAFRGAGSALTGASQSGSAASNIGMNALGASNQQFGSFNDMGRNLMQMYLLYQQGKGGKGADAWGGNG